jgi:hypothetical protein
MNDICTSLQSVEMLALLSVTVLWGMRGFMHAKHQGLKGVSPIPTRESLGLLQLLHIK